MSQCFYRYVLVCINLSLIFVCTGCSKDQQSTDPQVASHAEKSQQNSPVSGSDLGAGVVERSSVLLTIKDLIYQNPDSKAHTPLETIKFSALGRGVAYIEEHNDRQRVVLNGKPGNDYTEISRLSISPDGQHVSYSCMLGDKLQMILDSVASQPYIGLFEATYSPDSRHVAYLAQSIDTVAHIVLDDKSIEESPSAVSADLLFNSDSSKLLYHVRPAKEGPSAKLVIYDLKSGKKVVKDCLDTHIVMNKEKDRIVIAVKEGAKQRVVDFKISAPDDVHKSGLYDEIANFSIAIDGKGVAFTGVKGSSRYLVMNGKEERLPDDLAVIDTPVIRPDLKGVGVILATTERYNRRFALHHVLFRDGMKHKEYEQIKELVYSGKNSSVAYVAKENEKFKLVLNGKEGPAFDMIVTPMFSPDGSKLVYRARNDQKRFVVVVDVAKNEVHRHPEYEFVFMTVFTADGKSVAYGVKEGNQLTWKVEKL